MAESIPLRISGISAISAISLAAALLAGCAAVGPDYQQQTPTLDPGFIAAGSNTVRAEPAAGDIARFWTGFGDARLSALVERALAANGDVRIAQARLQEARALQGQADAAGLPGVGVDTSATRAVTPLTQRPGTTRSERTASTLDASFIAAWEIDLFGGLRRASEAAAARVGASEAGLQAAHTAVAAEVARNYLELRGLQQRQQLTEDSLVNQRDALRIASARVDAGRGTQLDLARAQGLVASTEAARPALQAAIEQTVYRLATLTAQPPRAMLAELSAPAPLPSLPVTDLATLPLGTPQQWLQRRPDLRAAERGRRGGHGRHRRGHGRAVPALVSVRPAGPECRHGQRVGPRRGRTLFGGCGADLDAVRFRRHPRAHPWQRSARRTKPGPLRSDPGHGAGRDRRCFQQLHPHGTTCRAAGGGHPQCTGGGPAGAPALRSRGHRLPGGAGCRTGSPEQPRPTRASPGGRGHIAGGGVPQLGRGLVTVSPEALR